MICDACGREVVALVTVGSLTAQGAPGLRLCPSCWADWTRGEPEPAKPRSGRPGASKQGSRPSR